MPRGGRRSGAGRKPKDARAIVLGMDGARMANPPAYQVPETPGSTAPADPDDLVIPPADLGEKERSAWSTHAPLALAQDTLVPATVPGFREFCQLFVHQAEMSARIAHLGRTSAEADRLVKRWEKGVLLLNAKMKDYKLTAFGKPEAAAIKKKKPAANPWAQVVQK